MALGDSFVRVVGTVLAILKTRFELISIEVEEEWTRLLTYLLLSLAGLFCLALTILLAVILIIVLCWESYRIPAMVGLIVFSLLSLLDAIGVKKSFARKPENAGNDVSGNSKRYRSSDAFSINKLSRSDG